MKHFFFLFFLLTAQLAYNQNWEQIGPYGGYFKDFFIHPSSGDVFVGSDDGGGIWKSEDNGANWELITGDYPNMTGWKLHLDDFDDDILYGCDVYGRYGVLKSTDQGASWTIQNNGLNSAYNKMVSGLITISSDSLIASTGEAATSTPPRPGNGLFKSIDGGENWTEAGLQGVTVPAIAKNVFKTIFAGTEGEGLYYSNDFGDNWFLHPDLPSIAHVHEIDIEDNVVVVGSVEGIFLSTNYGINFTNIGLAGDINFDLSIHSIGPEIEIFNSTFAGLQRYNSGTSSWSNVIHPELYGQLVIGIESNGSSIFCGLFSNGLILRSDDDGISWTPQTASPICTEVNDLYLDSSDPDHITAVMMGSYNIGGAYNKAVLRESLDGGSSWQEKGPAAHGLVIQSKPGNEAHQFVGTFSSGLFRSTDFFDSYDQPISGNKLIGDIAIDPENTDVILVSEIDLDLLSVSIKRSDNVGDSFAEVASLVCNRLLFDLSNSDSAYAATEDGIYLSTDNGLSWEAWILAGENILSLHSTDKGLFAGTNLGTLFRIQDDLASDITGDWSLPTEVKSIQTLHDRLVVGLNGAEKDTVYELAGSIWMSEDLGENWSNSTSNMSSTNIYGTNIIESDGNNLYLGTYGGGIFRSTDLNLGFSDEMSDQILVFPNPASETLFVHGIEEATDISLIDLSGRTVFSKQSATNVQAISLENIPAGCYFLILDEQEAIKVIVQ